MAIIKKVFFFVFLVFIIIGSAILLWGRDESLNSTAARFLQPPIVAEKENAYFYILGFTALSNKKPEEVGKQILMRHQLTKNKNFKKEEIEQIHFSENPISACGKESNNDINCMIQNRAQIEKAIVQNKLFIERYTELLKYTQFADMAPGSVTSISLPFLDLQRAKFAWWAKASLLIADNKFSDGLKLLQEDTNFWRMLSMQADNLLTRMVAIAMMQKQYELFSQLITRFPLLVDKEKELLLQIASHLSPHELSFRRALAGELRIAANTLRQFNNPIPVAKNSDRPCVDKNGKPCVKESKINFSLEHPFWRRTLFYRYNATLNLQANLLDKWAEYSEMPVQKIVQQKEPFIKTLELQYKPSDLSGWQIYNRLGKYLVAAGYFDVSQQIFKIYDLEGLIRLVNLQIQIASFHLTNEKIGPFLQTSDMELMNPYTGDAMNWDEKEESIFFRSLGNEDGGEIAITIKKPIKQ